MTKGEWTGADIGDLTPLLLPYENKNGIRIPRLNKAAAAFSLELAATAYEFKMDRWREAGWQDVSLLADNMLFTGKLANVTGGRVMDQVSGLVESFARHRVHDTGVINQALGTYGTFRQKEDCDTCKAVIMIKKHPFRSLYVVTIGFMGTGKRLFDWISNLRIETDEEIHKGFLQLTEGFEEQIPKMEFESTAEELGIKKLTLADILQECRREDSRFRIWMSGHSQGAAAMQVFQHRLVQQGVLRENIMGYGFASPKVARRILTRNTRDLPMYHILNQDDIIPRVGGECHLGTCLMFPSDEIMRMRCFGDAYSTRIMNDARAIAEKVHDTGDATMMLLGLIRALIMIPDDETKDLLENNKLGRILPDAALEKVTGRVDGMLGLAEGKVTGEYVKAGVSKALREETIDHIRDSIYSMFEKYGVKETLGAITDAVLFCHKLAGENASKGAAAYMYIVNERFYALSDDVHKTHQWVYKNNEGRVRGAVRRGAGAKNERTAQGNGAARRRTIERG